MFLFISLILNLFQFQDPWGFDLSTTGMGSNGDSLFFKLLKSSVIINVINIFV